LHIITGRVRHGLFSGIKICIVVHIPDIHIWRRDLSVLEYLATLLQTGLGSLVAYLAAHVLLCLLPAFFIAGALSALIPKEAITRYLGRDAPKWIS
jgi:uncharacterized membrane protein YraQ (UPF0718 family)